MIILKVAGGPGGIEKSLFTVTNITRLKKKGMNATLFWGRKVNVQILIHEM